MQPDPKIYEELKLILKYRTIEPRRNPMKVSLKTSSDPQKTKFYSQQEKAW